MDEKDQASTIKVGLDLGLGLNTYEPKRDNLKKNKRVLFLDLSIPLHQNGLDTEYSSPKFMLVDEKQGSDNRISNGSKADDCEGNYSKNCSRKKLRLDKDQITLLEESFEQHSSLTMAQKQILAERLHLKPRQVEVWFQNRRARTKLKQTEIDRKFLKKNCERLSDENRQLKRQLLELRPTVKTENPPQPPAAAATPLRQFFHSMPMTAAALKTCPSCEKTWNNRVGAKQEMPAAAVMEVSHGDKLNSRAGWLGKLGF